MGCNRLRNDKVKLLTEFRKIKFRIARKRRGLQANTIHTEFMTDPFFDQPGIGIDPEIACRPQERDQEAPQTKRPAPHIKDLVLFAHAQ